MTEIPIPEGAELCPGVKTDPAVFRGVLEALDLDKVVALTQEQLYSVESIIAENGRSLDGLQCVPRLRGLHVSQSKVADLRPLSTLDRLERLRLHSSALTDLSPLKAHKDSLMYLYLGGKRLKDLSVLAGFSVLSTVSLSDAPVVDLSPLKDRVEDLVMLRDIPASDLSQLIGQRAPRDLSFHNTGIRELDALLAVPVPDGGDVWAVYNEFSEHTLNEVVPKLEDAGWCIRAADRGGIRNCPYR